MAIQNLYPSIRPTLSLDFANTKRLDPRITFTRSTGATYYDGKTVAKAEENLLTYSQDFDNAAWSKLNATISANSITAPDGTSTADTLDEGTDLAAHIVIQGYVYSVGATYVFSCFLKNGTAQYAQLQLWGTASNYAGAEFDLAAGTVVLTNALGSGWSVVSSSISNVGNGWYRCAVVVTAGSGTGTGFGVCISDGVSGFDSRGRRFYTGSNRTLYAWGAQLEQRSSVTAYTPTTTQPITNYLSVLQSAAANVARFDHDPITGESKGLLIEEQRTNLLTYSEDFSNAAWYKTGASIESNAVVAPDGTLTADKIIATSATTNHFIYKSSTTIGTTYTWSACVKSAGEPNTIIHAYSISPSVFSFSTGTFTNDNPVDVINRGVIPLGSGWYRIWIVYNAEGESVFIGGSKTNSYTYTGDGYSGIYIWGAQLEVGSHPSSYIKTTSAQVTRAADAASMTGTNFSSWFNNSEGTVFTDVSAALGYNILSISDGSAATNAMLAVANANNQFQIYVNGGTAQTSLDGGTPLDKTYQKYAGAYAVNNSALSLAGGATVADTSCLIPVVNQLRIGAGGTGLYPINGHIRKLAYWPVRLANSVLQALSA